MHAKHGEQAAATQVDKSGVCAKERRVSELEDRAQDGGWERHVRVRDAEFVEVVYVGEAKDEGGDEDGFCEGGTRHDHERDRGGAEEDFFSERALMLC